MKKETVDIGSLVTYRNGDRNAIYQNNEYTSLAHEEVEPFTPVLMDIYLK